MFASYALAEPGMFCPIDCCNCCVIHRRLFCLPSSHLKRSINNCDRLSAGVFLGRSTCYHGRKNQSSILIFRYFFFWPVEIMVCFFRLMGHGTSSCIPEYVFGPPRICFRQTFLRLDSLGWVVDYFSTGFKLLSRHSSHRTSCQRKYIVENVYDRLCSFQMFAEALCAVSLPPRFLTRPSDHDPCGNNKPTRHMRQIGALSFAHWCHSVSHQYF